MKLAWLNKIYKCPFVAKIAMLVSFISNIYLITYTPLMSSSIQFRSL